MNTITPLSFDDLEFATLANNCMYSYMRNAVVKVAWAKTSRKVDQNLINYACLEALKAPDIGWATENAIIKGTNRLVVKKRPDQKVTTDQVRSMINVGLTDGLIERETIEYVLRPGPSTFFRLTTNYFERLIDLPTYE